MKIIRIIARLNVGGPARHVVWLTAALRDAGNETLLVTGVVPPGEGDMSYFASAFGVEPLIIPEMSREISPRDAVTIWKLYRLMLRERPDIVHTHTAKAGTVGRVAGVLYRWLTPQVLVGRPRSCRFVHTYHGHVFHSYYGRAKTKFFLTIERLLARFATDRIIVISPRQYDEIHKLFGVGRASQFSVVPLGLDTSVFADAAQRRSAARAALGVADDDMLVGIVGRLTEVKNFPMFFEAAALLKKELADDDASRVRPPRVRFAVIGDGHLRGELESQVHALGLDADVIFTGLRDDPENFYAALDVLALTSRNEGTPLTLIEAMASRRAVVATEVGGVVDLLGAPQTKSAVLDSDDGFTVRERGIGVRSRDAAAFARALRSCIENAELRAAFERRGREFVERTYSKERLVNDVRGLYNQLLLTNNEAHYELNRDADRDAV